jgi:hypothetical protein
MGKIKLGMQRSVAPRYHGPEVAPWPVGPGDTHRYFVQFYANNVMFNQHLTIRAVDREGTWASRVERERIVIPGSEDITDDFPRDDNGQVQWE